MSMLVAIHSYIHGGAHGYIYGYVDDYARSYTLWLSVKAMPTNYFNDDRTQKRCHQELRGSNEKQMLIKTLL